MKTLLKTICFLSLLLSTGILSAQTHLGLKLGSMLPSIQSNNLVVNARTSFHGGIFVNQKLGGKFAAQAELRYSYERMGNAHIFGSIHINTQMLRLPIEMVYTPLNWLEIHAGPSLAYKLDQRGEVVSLEGIVPTSFRPADIAQWEAGIEVGSAIKLGSRNKVGIRYYQALTSSAQNDSFQGRQYQLGLYLSSKLINF